MLRSILYVCFCLLFAASCKSPDARRPVKQTSGSFIKESAERNKAIYEQEERVITEIMDSNPDVEYVASESGFWYYYNQKDTLTTRTPVFGDQITFTYDIKDLSGRVILSEAETGLQNYIIDQTNQELISGLRDELKLMKVGETVTFLFPSYKAYGYYGIENKLGTNIPVQSTVTLRSIELIQEN